MSSACVCHTEEWCFYCNMYTPLEKKLELAVRALEEIADITAATFVEGIARTALAQIRGIET